MPSNKQFESLKLTIPFQVEYLDMYQLTDIINHHIKTVLEYIDAGKVATFTNLEEDTIYYLKKMDNTIIIKSIDEAGSNHTISENGHNFINWLYFQAPKIEIVGESFAKF